MKTYISFHEMPQALRALADRQFGPDGWAFERISVEGGEIHATERLATREKELGEELLHLNRAKTTTRWTAEHLVLKVEVNHFNTGERWNHDQRFASEYCLPINREAYVARRGTDHTPEIHAIFGVEYKAQKELDPSMSESPDVEAIMARVKDRLSKLGLFTSALVS